MDSSITNGIDPARLLDIGKRSQERDRRMERKSRPRSGKKTGETADGCCKDENGEELNSSIPPHVLDDLA